MQELGLVDWGSISAAESLPRGSHSADWMDALVVAMDLLHSQLVRLIYLYKPHFTKGKNVHF